MASAHILDPQEDGSRVSHEVAVSGSAADVPEGMVLWLAVCREGSTSLHPMEKLQVVGRAWRATAWVGPASGGEEVAGGKYEILVLLVTDRVSSDFFSYRERASATGRYPGMATASCPSEVLARRVVVRRATKEPAAASSAIPSAKAGVRPPLHPLASLLLALLCLVPAYLIRQDSMSDVLLAAGVAFLASLGVGAATVSGRLPSNYRGLNLQLGGWVAVFVVGFVLFSLKPSRGPAGRPDLPIPTPTSQPIVTIRPTAVALGPTPTTLSAETQWPRYVEKEDLVDCLSRGLSGSDCFRKSASIAGHVSTAGVVRADPLPHDAFAIVRVPRGARVLLFGYGDYEVDPSCGGQRPVQLSVTIREGATTRELWRGQADRTLNIASVNLPAGTGSLTLVGRSGDQDARCDDAVWVDLRFDR